MALSERGLLSAVESLTVACEVPVTLDVRAGELPEPVELRRVLHRQRGADERERARRAPARRSGVPVAGIDSSEAMLEKLREKPGAERVEATVGDMAATRVDGEFSLVYLVFNTIFNLTTQDGQVACFQNAAAHLRSGGRFVIEARVPELQRLPLGQTVLPWRADPDALSYYVYDVVSQRLSGRHYYLQEGRIQPSPIEMRYVWPSELDLMARLAGMRLEHRWGGWSGEPFTALSPAHVSVYARS